MTRTVVATANVLGSLSPHDASTAVAAVLAQQPDLVALQEWYLGRRWGLLRAHPDYAWFQPPLGGCAVGALRTRFDVRARRVRLLSPPGLGDRDGRRRLEPPRLATMVVHRDRLDGGTVILIDYHLVSQVQSRGAYREHDRPRLVARHRRESAALRRAVHTALTLGTTYACGDSNLHGFALPGLVSAWATRPDAPGTLGPRRRVDDVHGPTSPDDVAQIATLSDHRAVVATYL